jgi:hypothetical protein
MTFKVGENKLEERGNVKLKKEIKTIMRRTDNEGGTETEGIEVVNEMRDRKYTEKSMIPNRENSLSSP